MVGITIARRKGSTSNIKSYTSGVSFRTKQNSSSFPVRDSFLLQSCFPDTIRVLAGLSDWGVSILTGCVSRVALSSGTAGLRGCSVERCNPNKKPVHWSSSIQTGVLGPVYSCEEPDGSQWKHRMRLPQSLFLAPSRTVQLCGTTEGGKRNTLEKL